MSQGFISMSNSPSFHCLDTQVTSTRGNVLEKITLVETDQMDVLQETFP